MKFILQEFEKYLNFPPETPASDGKERVIGTYDALFYSSILRLKQMNFRH